MLSQFVSCDRGEKFELYNSIPTFREYLILEQKRPHAQHHIRGAEGAWSSKAYDSLDEAVKLTSIPVELPLRDVDRRVFGSD